MVTQDVAVKYSTGPHLVPAETCEVLEGVIMRNGRVGMHAEGQG